MKKDLKFTKEFEENGYTLNPFEHDLRSKMLSHIENHIRELAIPFVGQDKAKTGTLEEVAMSVSDEVWANKMNRAFRIFPKMLASEIHTWADSSIRKKMGRARSVVNVVYPAEAKINPILDESSLAIYWRCVRPGKPDAGRPHRDASFWVLEFEEGYDPKIPFPFDYLKDCIKIWIPLKGCTPKTTLQVIPHSHKTDIPTTVEQTEYGRRPSISKTWLDENESKFTSPVELSQGSCIIFDMNLVHRGPTHKNTELRISAELCFILK
jgi:hypothetical protein